MILIQTTWTNWFLEIEIEGVHGPLIKWGRDRRGGCPVRSLQSKHQVDSTVDAEVIFLLQSAMIMFADGRDGHVPGGVPVQRRGPEQSDGGKATPAQQLHRPRRNARRPHRRRLRLPRRNHFFFEKTKTRNVCIQTKVESLFISRIFHFCCDNWIDEDCKTTSWAGVCVCV